MQQKKKISVIVCSILAVLIGILLLCTNRILTHVFCNQINQSIAQVDSMDIRYGDVRLVLLAGKLRVNDVYFQSDTLYSQADSTRAVTRVEVGRMSIDGINYWQWFLRRKLDVRGITIHRPVVTTWIVNKDKDEVEKVMGDELREQLRKEHELEEEKMLQLARVFVEDATIRRITIKHANINIGAINNQLRTRIEDASIEVNGIGYSFIDSIPYHYNDSVFHFDIQNVHVTLPDGQTTIYSKGMTAKPGGIMHIDTTQAYAALSKDKKQYVHAQMAGLRIGGFDVQKFHQTKSLDIRSLHIDEPMGDVRVSTQAQNKMPQQQPSTKKADALRHQHEQEESLHEIEQQIKMFLTEIQIDTIQVHNICGSFQSSGDHLSAELDSLSLGVYGVGYSLLDSIPYHYNDSVYEFNIRHVHLITPDSLVDIEARNINYTNGGAFSIGTTRVHHTCDKWHLAELKGNTPQAWIDLTMGEFRTSQKNVVREAFTLEDGFMLDTINVRIDHMYVFKDNRYKPNKPYSLPQAALVQVDYPFHIHRVNADLREIEVDVAASEKAVGHLALNNLTATISNITAVHNDVIRIKANGNLGAGSLDLAFNLVVNQAANWDMNIVGKDLDLSVLDGFIYPIAGMHIGCNIQQLTAQYGGDSRVATGTFCMQYNNLSVVADKESPSPIRAIADMSELINSFAKNCLPHQNPKVEGDEPLAYRIKWKNNVWKEPGLFYIGPIINGALQTMLPGLFSINQIKEGKNKQTK